MRVIDLTLPVDNNMPGVNISVARQLEKDGWNATTLELYSHSGTHMDAPVHFLPGGDSIEKQDLSVCVGPARVINLAPTAPSQLIDVVDVASRLTDLEPNARLLFRTDWYKQYPSPEYRSGLPRLSLDLARWLVDRQVAMVGVEGPSVADVNNMQELTDVHQTLFKGRVLIIEALANLDQLTQEVVDFIALPLNIPGGDGTPVRAVAIEK